MASFYPNHHHHHHWEESIDSCHWVPNLEETIHYSLRNNSFERNRCLGLAKALSEEVQGRDGTLYIATLSGHEALQTFAKPIIDFNLGFRASYLVAKSVLSPRNCVQLDVALQQSLAYHERLLYEAELALSKKIIDMAQQVENLKNTRTAKPGIVAKLKNSLLSLRVEIKNLQLNSKYDKYLQKSHLIEVSIKYNEATNRIIIPHLGWYIFQRPDLNLNIVNSELISLQEVAINLGVSEDSIPELVKMGKIRCYTIGNRQVFAGKK